MTSLTNFIVFVTALLSKTFMGAKLRAKRRRRIPHLRNYKSQIPLVLIQSIISLSFLSGLSRAEEILRTLQTAGANIEYEYYHCNDLEDCEGHDII